MRPGAASLSTDASRSTVNATVEGGGTWLAVRLRRRGLVESSHRVHAVVVDARGTMLGAWGDVGRATLLRSAAKPFQAIPLIEDGAADRFGLDQSEVSVCCGSHNSEDAHLRAVRAILEKAGVPERMLACGLHPSLLEGRRDALAGVTLTPIMNNCSGKHAAMLALARHHGWPLEGYHLAEHPVQRRMAREVGHWMRSDLSERDFEVDGCGVPSYAVPLVRLAVAAARLAEAARTPGSPQRVVAAMTGHPFMVAGTGRLCTRLMEECGGRLFAKVGAEAVYMAGHPERGVGIALKVEDGAWRAAPCALLGVLDRVGLLPPEARESLVEFAKPAVTNTLGEMVGCLIAEEVPCSSIR